MNPSTVATFRFGMNTFDDDNSLPFEYDSDAARGRNPAFADAIPVQKFPSTDADRIRRHRLHRRQAIAITTPGASTARSPSWQARTASRSAPTTAFSASTRIQLWSVGRLVHVQRPVHRRATPTTRGNSRQRDRRPAARLSVGGQHLAGNSRFDNYLKYYGGFIQDDWRVTDKLTVNYGVRLEHETGLSEKNNQLIVGVRSRRRSAH